MESNLEDNNTPMRNMAKNFGNRRENTRRDDIKTSENITRIGKKKNHSDVANLLRILKTHFVFENYSHEELQQIVSKMFYAESKRGNFIFKEGDVGSCYMVLDYGLIEIIEDEKNKRYIKAGQAFGALSLLYGNERSTSGKCVEDCGLWVLERSNLRRAIEEIETKEFEGNRKILDYCDFLNFLTPEQKELLACGFILLKYSKGQIICQEGQPCCSLSIIKSGSVAAMKDGEEIRRYNVGDYYGETSLLYNTVKVCNLVALDDVHIIVLGRESLISILKEGVLVSAFRYLIKITLEKSAHFSKVPKNYIDKICENMPCEFFKAGDVIMKKGAEVNKLVLTVDGTLKSSKTGGELAPRGAIFGEDVLFSKKGTKTLDYDVIIEHDGVLSTITFEKLKSFFSTSIEEVIKAHEQSQKTNNQRKNNANIKSLSIGITLENLVVVKLLKKVPLGKIFLVKKNDHPQIFVLYCYSKSKISDLGVEKQIQAMTDVILQSSSPFILQYLKLFDNFNHTCVLAEYVSGLDVVDILKRIGTLNTYDTQFYIASLFLAIENLHSKSIIHRDIKCENIISDSNGYIKLFSFYTARQVKQKKANHYAKCTTIIGSPHYMAPEIIIGKGYGFPVDIWSLGICMFELMCGGVPFGEESEDPFMIFEETLLNEPSFPSFIKDKKAKKLILRLLNKNPDERMGTSLVSIKEDPWFESFDWDKLASKELKAPYIPVFKDLIEEEDIQKADSQQMPIVEELKTNTTMSSGANKSDDENHY